MTSIKKEQDAVGLAARPLDPDALIRFQEGAIVSREIVRGTSGSVTAFAFDKGQQLSEHTAPFDALVINMEGEAEITIGGQANIVKSGQLIVMPAGVPHALLALTRLRMLLVMIRG